jgi:GNAT superfamily N-acetyltransferase
MTLEIREHIPGEDIQDFIQAGKEVFRFDPTWVAPLDFELKERLSPKKNPLFQRAEVALFTARKAGRLVGRCSATVDREHLRLHKDDAGFFGFFDTIEDEEVARALMEKAAEWLRSRGMKRMMGPISLYFNDEVGCLIEGFDTPPNLMMAHSRRYQGRLIEACGCEKEKDLLCWRYDVTLPFPNRVIKAWEQIRSLPEVKLRSVNVHDLRTEMANIMAIYNDAWDGKWGMVPALPAEVEKVTNELRLIVDPDIAFVAEINGEAAGMCIMLPNMNEAIRDLNGKLFTYGIPIGAAKFLWRMKVKKPKSTRLMMLGIRQDVRQNVKRYGGLSAAMYVEVAKRGAAKGYQWGELSWTREDDAPINLGIRSMGAHVYKKYRVYKKAL